MIVLRGQSEKATAPNYGKYVGALAVVILLLITLNTVLTTPNGSAGISPGTRLPPFAVPLAIGALDGDANVAARANQGSAGRRPACSVRGRQILNLCEQYENGPVVLVLFVAGGDCPRAVDELASVLPQFPGVRGVAVAIKGDRQQVRRLVSTHHWVIPVGYDRDGILANLYRLATCPQLTFSLPGGIAQGHAILQTPTVSKLRERIRHLVSDSVAAGWREPGVRG